MQSEPVLGHRCGLGSGFAPIVAADPFGQASDGGDLLGAKCAEVCSGEVCRGAMGRSDEATRHGRENAGRLQRMNASDARTLRAKGKGSLGPSSCTQSSGFRGSARKHSLWLLAAGLLGKPLCQ